MPFRHVVNFGVQSSVFSARLAALSICHGFLPSSMSFSFSTEAIFSVTLSVASMVCSAVVRSLTFEASQISCAPAICATIHSVSSVNSFLIFSSS